MVLNDSIWNKILFYKILQFLFEQCKILCSEFVLLFSIIKYFLICKITDIHLQRKNNRQKEICRKFRYFTHCYKKFTQEIWNVPSCCSCVPTQSWLYFKETREAVYRCRDKTLSTEEREKQGISKCQSGQKQKFQRNNTLHCATFILHYFLTQKCIWNIFLIF